MGSHNYVLTAKEYIDITYPSRHTLMLGDSRTSVPLFIHNNKDVKFDIIFIDGCHYYDYAKADMENCMKLAHKDTIVIMDDTIFTSGWEACWTQGPTQVWKEYLSTNKIMELNHNDYSYGRGMSWGKYIL